MPREVFDAHYNFLRNSAILSFEEIARLRASRRPRRGEIR